MLMQLTLLFAPCGVSSVGMALPLVGSICEVSHCSHLHITFVASRMSELSGLTNPKEPGQLSLQTHFQFSMNFKLQP